MHEVRNSSWNPTLFVLPNKNYLKKGKRKILVVREFLFGNVQIGVKSQGLLYKASCMELGTPHETQPYLFYQTKIIWEREREREREREKKKKKKKGTDEIIYTKLRNPPLFDVALSVHASLFLLSMSLLCVCTRSLFVSLPSFFIFPPFFFFFFVPCAWLSLFIEKFQRNCSLIFLSTDQLMEQFALVFLSITPNFVFSRAHYSAFCSFYPFRPTLNSFFSAGDISISQLFGLTFLVF